MKELKVRDTSEHLNNKHDIIPAEERVCTCVNGEHVPVWHGWVSEELEGAILYCRKCNSVWHEI